MLDLSPEKILVLGILALVVLGPTRLPGAARTLGRILAQLKSMSTTFQSEVRDAMSEPSEAFNSAIGEFNLTSPADIRRSVRDAVTSTIMPPAPSASSGVGPAGSGVVPSPEGGPGWPGWPPEPDDPGLN